jgi:hypothetical protein
MPYQVIQPRSAIFTPVSATTDETAQLFGVSKGTRVIWASARVQAVASVGQVGTVSLGDGTAVAGYIGAFTPTLAANPVGTLIPGVGALLANSGGTLYIVDDTVDVTFDYTSGGVLFPKVRFTIGVVREWLY